MAATLRVPTNQKYKKPFNLKCSTIKNLNDTCILGTYGLKILKSGKLPYLQLQALYKTFLKILKKRGKCWIRFNFNSMVTRKPQEVRMGGGKGNFDHWEINVRAGMVLFEFLFYETKTFPPNLIKLFTKVKSKISFPVKLISKN